MTIKVFTSLQLDQASAFVAKPIDAFRREAKISDFPDFVPESGMLYVTARAISSRVNANHDGWPADELRKAYKSFAGKPVFVDHQNFDEKRSRGVILQSRLLEDKLASGHQDTWIELLIEVDAQAFPKLAQAIISGDIDAVSMGADVEFTVCSACGNKARDVTEYCQHIPSMKGRRVTVERTAGVKQSVLVFEDCYGVGFFEISFVFDPADESALITDHLLYTGPRVAASRRTLRHLRLQGESVDIYQGRVSGISKAASRAALTDGDVADLQRAGVALCEGCNGRGAVPRRLGGLQRCTNCGGSGAVRVALLNQPENGSSSGSALYTPVTTVPPGIGKQADEMLMALPQEPVQTIQEEMPCPICGAPLKGSDQTGWKCSNCPFEMPPEAFRDPDTDKDPGIDPDLEQGKPDSDEKDEKGEEAQDEDDEDPTEQQEGGKKVTTKMEEVRARRKSAEQRTADGSEFSVHDVGTVYDNTSENNPAVATAPYGEAGGVGQATPPAEPPFATTDGERNRPAKDDVQNLDTSVVTAPQGQSEVDVNGAAPVMSSKELIRRADVLERRALQLRRQAETVTQDDVTNLDVPPSVDVQPDAVADVTRPTAEPNQLALADTTDVINDGSETGLPLDGRGRGQVNEFQNVGPYGQTQASIDEIRRDAGARVLRIAQLVDARVELGLVDPQRKLAEVARFEDMDDGQIDGWIDATDEIKQARVRVAGRRIVAGGPGPEFRPKAQPKTAGAGPDDDVMDSFITMS